MDPIVSVIIPTHNREQFIATAIQSVLAQSCQDFEIIIVNDASTDNTKQILFNLAKQDKRIQIINNTVSLGGAASRNAGIAISKGKWIAFLDDDDTWHPQKLEIQIAALEKNPNAIASSCAYTVNYPLKIKKRVITPNLITLNKLVSQSVLGGASVCICLASILKKINGFDERLRSSQDWDLWVRLRLQGNIISVKDPLVDYYVHFNYRISNNMRSKYSGSRTFYFKHKHLMDNNAKINNLAFLCFIRSRQNHRSFLSRIYHLLLAINHSPTRSKIAYLISSLPRIILFPLINLRRGF